MISLKELYFLITLAAMLIFVAAPLIISHFGPDYLKEVRHSISIASASSALAILLLHPKVQVWGSPLFSEATASRIARSLALVITTALILTIHGLVQELYEIPNAVTWTIKGVTLVLATGVLVLMAKIIRHDFVKPPTASNISKSVMQGIMAVMISLTITSLILNPAINELPKRLVLALLATPALAMMVFTLALLVYLLTTVKPEPQNSAPEGEINRSC